MATGMDTPTMASVESLLGPTLTAEQARDIFAQGAEATVFALLTLAKMLAEKRTTADPGPSTPSGMRPVYEKPSTKKRKRKSGTQERPSWQSAIDSSSHRPSRRTYARMLSGLSRSGDALSSFSPAADRRYSPRYHARSDRAYDSSLLVLAAYKAGGSDGARCTAGLDSLGLRVRAPSAWLRTTPWATPCPRSSKSSTSACS